jgi:hypothetical protein
VDAHDSNSGANRHPDGHVHAHGYAEQAAHDIADEDLHADAAAHADQQAAKRFEHGRAWGACTTQPHRGTTEPHPDSGVINPDAAAHALTDAVVCAANANSEPNTGAEPDADQHSSGPANSHAVQQSRRQLPHARAEATRQALMVGADVVTVGTIIGALIGTVTFLLKILVAAKQAHIESLEKERLDIIAERDLFRNLALSGHEAADRPRPRSG